MIHFAIFLIIFTKVFSKGDDVFYNINSMKILHKVSDKFLSISIDPAVLLAGANLSEISLNLAKHLSPAYIRMAGPSTQFVKYLDNEEETFSHKNEGANVYITPSMWFGINEWFSLANLTPVFAINDEDQEKGVWDPRSTVPLLEMSDKFGVTCYWQLGYDCSNKTTIQYVEDLNILKQTLNGFPEHNSTWKIIGSDLSSCSSSDLDDNSFGTYMKDLDETVDAVMWQSPLIAKKHLGLVKAALWTSVPKDTLPATFQTAIDWAVKVGEAATMEYDVIFREPRLLEFTKDTPIYWFSYLHKKLMGSNVLEIRSVNPKSGLAVFAHCTKRQNDFVRSGAVTILMVNNGPETATVNVRLGNILMDKSMEVQLYFLKASNESDSKVLLNDRLLTMDLLRKQEDVLRPKLRRAKLRPHISLEIPAETIAFSILTGAKYSLCINNEEDLSSILEEINEDQGMSLSSEVKIEGRRQEIGNVGAKFPSGHKITLEDIKKNILKEMEEDKSYYGKVPLKLKDNTNFLEKDHKQGDSYKREMLHKHLKMFIERSRKNDFKTGFKDRPATNSLHLTIQEIEEVLKRRAKAKAAAKNVKLTSSELDMLVDKATLKIPKHFISKRDINRILLEEKANFYKNNIFNQEVFEQYAKERKLFPKFRRSHQEARAVRAINTALLNLKALMEENKLYLVNHNEHSGKPPKRVSRDINLDLLKRRSEPISHLGRRKIAVQPNLKHRKHGFMIKDSEKYSLDDQTSEELFDDLATFKDLTSQKDSFAFFKNNQAKSLMPRNKKLPKNSEEYLQFLKASAEEFENEGEEPCVEEFGYWMTGPKYGKKNAVMDLWALKSVKNEKSDNGQSSPCVDLNNLFYDEDYGFFRKKRDTQSVITKEKLRSLKKDIRKEVKKLKQQLKEDKARYLAEKIKNKTELIKRKHRMDKINIQIIPKNEIMTSDKSIINEVIANADINENTIIPPLDRHIEKRSLISNDISTTFGQYKPLTSSLKAWRPVDILRLDKNNFPNWPTYSWIQDRNMRNAILKTNNYFNPFGLRKRRFIDSNSDVGHNAKLPETTTALNKKKIETAGAIDKMTAKANLDYVERVLGQNKIKRMDDFFKHVSDNFTKLSRKLTSLFKDLF